MSTFTIPLLSIRSKKKISKLSQFALWPGVILNLQWLELPISRTNFHGPKDVRVIAVILYITTATTFYIT